MFEELYLVGQRKRQLIMYLMDMRMNFSVFLVTFTAYNGVREALCVA